MNIDYYFVRNRITVKSLIVLFISFSWSTGWCTCVTSLWHDLLYCDQSFPLLHWDLDRGGDNSTSNRIDPVLVVTETSQNDKKHIVWFSFVIEWSFWYILECIVHTSRYIQCTIQKEYGMKSKSSANTLLPFIYCISSNCQCACRIIYVYIR